MPTKDEFAPIARHYDTIMEHVKYHRWFAIASRLAELLPEPMRHLDAACGTGTLARLCRGVGWDSYGFDLSAAMVREARRNERVVPVTNADLCAIPFRESFDFVTCLFDSINFLLDPIDLRKAAQQLAGAMRPGGIIYLDAVTERMVKQHFAGQKWTEDNGGFSTTWDSRYDTNASTSETSIRVNTGGAAVIRERIYSEDELSDALRSAGLNVLGLWDAETWRAPRKRTIRLDIVACKGDASSHHREFDAIAEEIRAFRVSDWK
jgi:SAM-dependent methyltransferase